MIRHTVFAAMALVVSVAAPAVSAADAPACALRFVTSLDLDLDPGGRVRVPVTMNHQTFKMLVDTGAGITIVSTRTTKVLGLKPLATDQLQVTGSDGRKMGDFVTLDQFSVGGLQAGTTQMVVDPRSLPQYDGLFGEDFLSNYDLDFDFAKGKLNFVKAEGCTDGVVYWTKGNYGAIPFALDQLAIKLTVTLDGKPVKAAIDTGAQQTVMNLEAAADDFGIDAKLLPTGVGAKTFKTMSIGDVTVSSPFVYLESTKRAPLLSDPHPPMLIGMNVLRNLHVYISHQQKKIYVTPATQY